MSRRAARRRPVRSLEEYRSRGGGRGVRGGGRGWRGRRRRRGHRQRAAGRGGGGFPTGRKWTGIRDAGPGRRFAVCNAAEGEPGTFKDRALLRHDPYRVLEGLAIASFAVGAEAAYIATKARLRAGGRAAGRPPSPRCAGARAVRRPDHRPGARARRVPLRRGEGAARGDRGPRPAPPAAAALRARAVRHRRADRLAVGRRAAPSGRRASRTRRW